MISAVKAIKVKTQIDSRLSIRKLMHIKQHSRISHLESKKDTKLSLTDAFINNVIFI